MFPVGNSDKYFVNFSRENNILFENHKRKVGGFLLRMPIEKIIFLFLNQNTCYGYSKEPSQ